MADFDIDVHKGRSLAETAAEVLARRADSLARETTEEESSHRIALLLFRIGEEWYTVRVSDVREIFQEYEVTPIPCVPDFVSGVVNVRGEILSITDPARMMRIGMVDASGPVAPPAVVIAGNDVVTALVVDEIGDIVEVPAVNIEPPVSIIDRSQAEFIAGSVYVGEQMVGLINIERILQPITTGARY